MQSGIDARCPCESLLQAASAQGSSVAGQLTEQELFSRLHKRHDWQESHIGEFSVLRTYTMRKEDDVVSAREVVNMKYSPPGRKTFTIVSAKGSRFIRTTFFSGSWLVKWQELENKAARMVLLLLKITDW
jgi:hypothetical protein